MDDMTNFPEIPQESPGETDWAYAMRRDMQEIVPGLFLGPYAAAMKSKLEFLKLHQITHIVCIRQKLEANIVKPNFPDHFQYLVLDISDNVTENIIKFFPRVKEFINQCFSSQGRALIHSNAGTSRSAAFVIGYLMEQYGLCYREALQHVQRRRFCINPNEGFAQQLKEYEPIYRARLTLEKGHSSYAKGDLKRKFHEEDDAQENSMECSS
ncbi:hypothetical protein CAPTEDRAFT_164406 [Capitella teleta]|uniref:Tyrosine-protein phosphatase domain-containing protein n=1 Tax=Capitella teleta TaxID=283909 RepID=R7UVI6_CAPTE|nr:hypothetical protein CAPTEDRAFT_164406 [Capitella teleta]|eukprot:ELU10633.1 hypothetical protein CAPTEDRAFT_164406 [Capitella teleta]